MVIYLRQLFFFLLVLSGIGLSGAQAAVPGDLSFTVLREGDPIGKHTMTFTENNGVTRVDVVTDISVKLAFITVYRFEHKAKEIWKEGHLSAISSVTNDDGTNHVLEVKEDNGRLSVTDNGKTHKAPLGIIPASLWSPETVNRGVLLNTLNGKIMRVKVNNAGEEKVKVKGKDVTASHYVISGDLNRELWFDAEKTLVKVRFKGNDGSEIVYALQ